METTEKLEKTMQELIDALNRHTESIEVFTQVLTRHREVKAMKEEWNRQTEEFTESHRKLLNKLMN